MSNFATPWTIVHKARPSMGLSQQEYWCGLPFPFPGDLADLGIEPKSPALWVYSLLSELPGKLVYVNICMCIYTCMYIQASQVAQWVKNLPAMQKTHKMQVEFLGREDPLEEGMATYFSILAWRIPRTEEPGGLQSIGLQRVRHD